MTQTISVTASLQLSSFSIAYQNLFFYPNRTLSTVCQPTLWPRLPGPRGPRGPGPPSASHAPRRRRHGVPAALGGAWVLDP